MFHFVRFQDQLHLTTLLSAALGAIGAQVAVAALAVRHAGGPPLDPALVLVVGATGMGLVLAAVAVYLAVFVGSLTRFLWQHRLDPVFAVCGGMLMAVVPFGPQLLWFGMERVQFVGAARDGEFTIEQWHSTS